MNPSFIISSFNNNEAFYFKIHESKVGIFLFIAVGFNGN